MQRTVTVEIGSRFRHDWETDDDEYYDEDVTVMGYIYYDDMLYYTCISDDDIGVDVHHRDVEMST